MMKFVVKEVRNGCRVGQLSGLVSHPDMELETPLCMLYTRAGSAPHLSREMLKRIADIPPLAHMPLPGLVESLESIQAYGQGIAKFAALPEHPVYTSVQDMGTAVPSGYNDKSGTAVWSKGGKVKLDIDLYTQNQEALRPSLYQALSDGDTSKDSTRKRVRKSVERTLQFLDQCVDKQQESKVLKSAGLIGVIEGGYLEEERKYSAKETSKRPVAGFIIEGFHTGGPETEAVHFPDIKNLISLVLGELPEDKPRFMHWLWRPDILLEAVQLGLDIFDSSYPYVVTERGGALVFSLSIPGLTPVEKSSSGENGPVHPPPGGTTEDSDRPFEINLKSKRYFDDFTPLVPGCPCYTCCNHTQSYICHLLNTSELLAGVLLMIHNFHHYFRFVEQVREAIKKNKVTELQSHIQAQI